MIFPRRIFGAHRIQFAQRRWSLKCDINGPGVILCASTLVPMIQYGSWGAIQGKRMSYVRTRFALKSVDDDLVVNNTG